MSSQTFTTQTRRKLLRSATAAVAGSLCAPLMSATANDRPKASHHMRPSLYVTTEKIEGLRSLEEVRESIRGGHGKRLWQEMIRRADADLKEEPLHGGSRNYDIVNKAGGRVMRHALACLISQDDRYRDAAVAQIEAMFDSRRWPNWKDENHPAYYICCLRHGQLCGDLGLAYDWLYPFLSNSQRQMIVEGIDRYGVQPYFQCLQEEQRHLVNRWNNITIVVRGGLGIAGMAMGDDHPQSQLLIDLATEHMEKYRKVYGPEGSYNESVGYAVSTMDVVRYFEALRSWSAVLGRANPHENILGTSPYPEFCRWLMYFTLPPGREACLGNGPAERQINLYYAPAIASAARDGVIQWYYLNNLHPTEQTQLMRRYSHELLWYDPTILPVSPEGRMPHGHAFRANNMCVSSRTDWNPQTTPCVVYGKGGDGHSPHNHHDAGQVCIDGHGQRLIVDFGWGGYDYGSYGANVRGHNVLMFDGEDMIKDAQCRAKLLDAEFDDRRGGYWSFDTTALYDGVLKVVRTVVHLNPGVVAVLDEAAIPRLREVSLRWHTISRAEPDGQGRFLVQGREGAHLASRVLRIDPGPIAVAHSQKGEGRNLRHRCEAVSRTQKCQILSVFCVFAPEVKPMSWELEGSIASIDTPEGRFEVQVNNKTLTVTNCEDEQHRWDVDVWGGVYSS